MQKICSVNELRATFMFRPSFTPAPTHLVMGGTTRIHTALINSALCSGRPTPTPSLCYPLVLPQHQRSDSHRLPMLKRATPCWDGTANVEISANTWTAIISLQTAAALKESKTIEWSSLVQVCTPLDSLSAQLFVDTNVSRDFNFIMGIQCIETELTILEIPFQSYKGLECALSRIWNHMTNDMVLAEQKLNWRPVAGSNSRAKMTLLLNGRLLQWSFAALRCSTLKIIPDRCDVPHIN